MTIWNIYGHGIFYGRSVSLRHLVYLSILVCLDQEKSGNPAPDFSRLEPNLRELKSSLNSWTPRFVRRNFVLIDIYQKVCCPKVDRKIYHNLVQTKFKKLSKVFASNIFSIPINKALFLEQKLFEQNCLGV
jgi:hypothetical protein